MAKDIDATKLDIKVPDYKYGPDPENLKKMGIHINDGEFEGLFFTLNTISASENEDETATIHFDYDVIYKPDNVDLKVKDIKDKVENIIASIVHDIVLNSVKEDNE